MSWWQLPAVLLTFLTWLQAQPVSLADAAAREGLRRQLTPKSVRSLTNDDVDGLPRRPLPTLPVEDVPDTKPAAGAAAGAAPAKPGEAHDETWWRSNLVAARSTLERDQMLSGALQSSINALTNDWSARDDPAQRQQLFDQRTRAISELDHMKEQIDADRKALAALEEEARRQNVPAGWLR